MRKVLNGRQFFSFVPKFMMTFVNTHITMITCAVNAYDTYAVYLCATKRSMYTFICGGFAYSAQIDSVFILHTSTSRGKIPHEILWTLMCSSASMSPKVFPTYFEIDKLFMAAQNGFASQKCKFSMPWWKAEESPSVSLSFKIFCLFEIARRCQKDD